MNQYEISSQQLSSDMLNEQFTPELLAQQFTTDMLSEQFLADIGSSPLMLPHPGNLVAETVPMYDTCDSYCDNTSQNYMQMSVGYSGYEQYGQYPAISEHQSEGTEETYTEIMAEPYVGYPAYANDCNSGQEPQEMLCYSDQPYPLESAPSHELSTNLNDSGAELSKFEQFQDVSNSGFAPAHVSDYDINASYFMYNQGMYMPAPPTMQHSSDDGQYMTNALQQGYDSGFSSPPSLAVLQAHYFSSPSEQSYQLDCSSNYRPATRTKKVGRPRKTSLISNKSDVDLVCPHPGCNKKFNRFHNLKSHLIVHTDGKPFKCNQCDLSFRRNHDLRRHVRMHLGFKPFSCRKCGKGFCRSDALKRHVKVDACGEYIGIPEIELSNADLKMIQSEQV